MRKVKEKRKCGTCGKPFRTEFGWQIYCGNTCKVAAYRARQREKILKAEEIIRQNAGL